MYTGFYFMNRIYYLRGAKSMTHGAVVSGLLWNLPPLWGYENGFPSFSLSAKVLPFILKSLNCLSLRFLVSAGKREASSFFSAQMAIFQHHLWRGPPPSHRLAATDVAAGGWILTRLFSLPFTIPPVSAQIHLLSKHYLLSMWSVIGSTYFSEPPLVRSRNSHLVLVFIMTRCGILLCSLLCRYWEDPIHFPFQSVEVVKYSEWFSIFFSFCLLSF